MGYCGMVNTIRMFKGKDTVEWLTLYEVVFGLLSLRGANIVFKPIYWLRLKILVC